MHNSLTYFALLDEVKSPGVSKKIDGLVTSSNNIGLPARKIIFPNNGKGLVRFIKCLFFCESDVVFIRFSDFAFPFIFLVLVYLRVKRKKIVVDIPTPRIVCIDEIESLNSGRVTKLLRKLLSFLSSSWVLFPATSIIQYADEHWWFEFGVKYKSMKMGNGILIDDDSPIIEKYASDKKIVMIAVAQLASWHGFDRMLVALSRVKSSLTQNIEFVIVGDGHELENLKMTANTLGLDNVVFKGRLIGVSLKNELLSADVGVSSLGLFRKGLTEASDLKTREYMSYGLPVISSGTDPDFHKHFDFRMLVDNSNEVESIIRALEKLESRLLSFEPSEIKRFSKDNLSMESKLKIILERI